MKRLNLLVVLSVMAGMALFTFSCKKAIETKDEPEKQQDDNSQKTRRIKVGLAMAENGLGDMSFTDMQYAGLKKAEKLYNIDFIYLIPEDNSVESADKILRELARQECELIFTSFFFAIEAVKNLAADYPDIRFVILDNPVKGLANVTSAVYAQHEGSFVVGYLAAKFSKTKKIGFIGGVDIPVVKAFLKGFEEGIAYSKTNASLKVEYLSRFPEFSGFNDPDKGYKTAGVFYNQGIDVIYNVAGLSGSGIIKAAGDKKKFVIGVDANQDGLAEGYVLTSMLKRLDYSVVDIVDLYIKGELKGDYVYNYSYKNFGVSITDMQYTRDIIGDKLIRELREIESKIANGEIVVTNTQIEY